MQEIEPDSHASFICSVCNKYSIHPTLTECGHLFWYLSVHLAGHAYTSKQDNLCIALYVEG